MKVNLMKNEAKSGILKWMMRFFAVVFIITSCYDFFSVAQSNEDALKKENLPACLKQLINASSFDDGQRGEAPTVTPNYKAYQEASGMISGIETADLNLMMDRGSPAGKLYAAVLLKQSGRVGDNLSFDRLLNDHSKVRYQSGCKVSETEVSEIAKSFIANNKYMNFQLSMFCKLKAPIPKSEPSADGQAPKK